MMIDRQPRYDRRTVLLHWWTAGIVAFQWAVGRLNHLLPKGPVRLDIWSVHVLVGFALVAIIGARIAWRLTKGRRLPPPERGVRHMVAEGTHALLYFLLVGVAGLGVFNVFAHGFPLFGAWSFPRIGGEGYAKVANGWHALFSNLIMALALFHALAALFHRYVLKDQVLTRMWSSGIRQ
jgi:cytochrome b561